MSIVNSMSSSSNKKRSYYDAVIGGRNEFIGSPMTSGGKAGASGASTPSRDEKVKSNKRNKSPAPVVPETPALPETSAVQQSGGDAATDWEAAFNQALTIGQPELIIPAEAGVECSVTLVITRSLPVTPEHRSVVVKFIREVPWEKLPYRKVASSALRSMVVKDLRTRFDCNRSDAERLLKLSALIHQRFYSGGSETVKVEHHAIALWCGQILFENNEAYSDSDFVHSDVLDGAQNDDGAGQASSPSRSGSPSSARHSSRGNRDDEGDDADALPEDSQSPPAPSLCQLLPPSVDGIAQEERPAFVEYVLSLLEEPSQLDVRAPHTDKATRKRRERALLRLMERFTIGKADAQRLLRVSYLVHRRFRALDDGTACEHIGFATLAGRVIHRDDRLMPSS